MPNSSADKWEKRENIEQKPNHGDGGVEEASHRKKLCNEKREKRCSG